ncbi:MAG: DNA replication and repair protein RecF [Thermoanaerobaculales bacterium]|jgi:DNA replication and repair protein RecF|nr:DNA replication and repair protein RecF [Thermoanaerobaculales bacterium]
MHLQEIRAQGFRNLEGGRVAFHPRGNLITGANGQGKTNLLEAVTVLGNLRSFRTPAMRRVVRQGEGEFLLEGVVETAAGPVRLAQQVTPGPPVRRVMSAAGAPVDMAGYLEIFPVVALSGADRDLVSGVPASRRSFLDRFAFLLEKEYFQEIREYRRILRQRNAALVSPVADDEMRIWEERLAAAAALVVHRRRLACRHLVAGFGPIYEVLRSDGFPDVAVAYRGESGLEPAEKVQEVEEYYRKRYNETRTRDRRTGFTSEGPHRHDLALRANGRTVRHVLSSGQIKVVAAALRLASLKQVERERGELLPVIIDDVDAELDSAVMTRLIEYLDGERQLFLSSADAEILGRLAVGSGRIDISNGAVIDPAGEAHGRNLHS